MTAVAHRARLDAPADNGERPRAYYEDKAARAARQYGDGSPEHRAALEPLEGPEIPGDLAYLLGWHSDVSGRSGSMNGELTWPALLAWRTLKGVDLMPHEADALMQLDAVRLHPPAEDVDAVETFTPAWPERSV